eukprot:6251382-Amphidinium_carterae.1
MEFPRGPNSQLNSTTLHVHSSQSRKIPAQVDKRGQVLNKAMGSVRSWRRAPIAKECDQWNAKTVEAHIDQARAGTYKD